MCCLLSFIIYGHFIIQVTFCCVPVLQKPNGGIAGTSEIPLEQKTSTTTPPTPAPTPTSTLTPTSILEKAKTNFIVQHKNQLYACTFQFLFSSGQGIIIQENAESECKIISSTHETNVKNLEKHEFVVTTEKAFDVTCSLNAVFEETTNGILLAEIVVRQSIKCFPSPEQCLTEDGPDYPNTCSFPFIYLGRIYQGCTDWRDGIKMDKLWCATETNEDKTIREDRWAWCNSFCDYCGGKDVMLTTTTTTTPNVTSSLGGKTTSKSSPNKHTSHPVEKCTTEKGQVCTFPFKDGDKEYSACANFRDIYHWCAISVLSDGTYGEWDKCDPLNCKMEGEGECQTISGPDPFKPCIFPFKDGSQEYSKCAPWRSQFWCATSISTSGSYESYGYCKLDGSCPLSSSRKTNQKTESELTCGYNCYVDVNTQMVSFTEGVTGDFLRAPTTIVGELTNAAWNELPDNKFQFLIGQKGIDLECPKGTMFNKFPMDSQISVTCTGEYSFTVKGLQTENEWEGEENVNFGCNPCPVDYLLIYGFMSNDDSLAVYNSIETMAECLDLCETVDGCQVFQYGLRDKQCSLHTAVKIISTKNDEDYPICKSKKHKCTIPALNNAMRIPDKQSIREGENVSYTCMETTEMIGESQNTCNQNGLEKEVPWCAVCCYNITLSFEPEDEHHENSEYYDTYILQDNRKNNHIWYKSESNLGAFSIWKSEKSIWALGETSTGKIKAQMNGDGCPSDTDNEFHWIEVKRGKIKPIKKKGSCHWTSLDIWTLPVGQGDSTLIKCPGSEEHAIVDMGKFKNGITSQEYGNWLFRQLHPHYKVGHIFLTHPDADHISFFLRTTEELMKRIKTHNLKRTIMIHLGGSYAKWQAGGDIAKAISNYIDKNTNEKKLKHKYYDHQLPNFKTSIVPLCKSSTDVNMQIITAGRGTSKNENSLIMKLKYFQLSMLMMGDFESSPMKPTRKPSKVWQNTLKEQAIKNKIKDSTVVIVPHHGSTLGISDQEHKDFYDLVKPRYAIVSAHIQSDNGHPRCIPLNSVCYRKPNANHKPTKQAQCWIKKDQPLSSSNCDPAKTEIFQTSKVVKGKVVFKRIHTIFKHRFKKNGKHDHDIEVKEENHKWNK